MRSALPEGLTADPFAFVRASCARVAANASAVRIDREWLEAYAAGLPVDEIAAAHGTQLPSTGGDREALSAFVLQLDAINFGSGWFPELAKLPGASGYRTIEAHLVEHYEHNGPIEARKLEQADAAFCAALFGQRLAEPGPAELMALFAQAWRDLGALVRERFDGSFLSLVHAADGSAAALVRTLLELPFYRDVAEHEGEPVAFLKRAQITTADLAHALPDRPRRFTDLDRLTLFADNLVPHVLRIDGVLHFDPDLVARIDREELIAPGSREEVEIRACAVHAVELLAEQLGEAAPPRQIDRWLWTRGARPEYKARPRHRSRCVFY